MITIVLRVCYIIEIIWKDFRIHNWDGQLMFLILFICTKWWITIVNSSSISMVEHNTCHLKSDIVLHKEIDIKWNWSMRSEDL
jgi:hypothetical protein